MEGPHTGREETAPDASPGEFTGGNTGVQIHRDTSFMQRTFGPLNVTYRFYLGVGDSGNSGWVPVVTPSTQGLRAKPLLKHYLSLSNLLFLSTF